MPMLLRAPTKDCTSTKSISFSVLLCAMTKNLFSPNSSILTMPDNLSNYSAITLL